MNVQPTGDLLISNLHVCTLSSQPVLDSLQGHHICTLVVADKGGVTLQRLVELAELREDVLQQLQSVDAVKMQMAEQKLAEQTRLSADLDLRLQAACSTLDCSAGDFVQPLSMWLTNVVPYPGRHMNTWHKHHEAFPLTLGKLPVGRSSMEQAACKHTSTSATQQMPWSVAGALS